MQKSSTIALIKNNKLLLLLRGSTAPFNPDKYCLPGGMVDSNETLIDCAIRELKEETGVSLNKEKLNELVIKYPSGYKKIIYVYKDDNFNQPINISWEHQHYRWVSSGELDYANTVPNFNRTINCLVDNGYMI